MLLGLFFWNKFKQNLKSGLILKRLTKPEPYKGLQEALCNATNIGIKENL